jgi:YidC/Oxa1 family membrane protein insertase
MFQTYLVDPLYNSFIFLIGISPYGDVGIAIIVLTLIIRAVFYPAFAASIRTQMGMQAVQGELAEINKKYKDNAGERAKQTMALYKERKISPFAGFIAILVQLPIFLALYFAFFREGLPNVDTSILYSFVHAPATVNLQFLGFINLLAAHNILLTVVVGGLQYLVTHFSLSRTVLPTSLSDEKKIAQKMQQRLMLYFLPVMIAVISYSLPAAVGVYFAAGNLVSLGQEWLIRRDMSKKSS